MSDLISRQAAIDALYDWSEHSITDAEAWHIRQVIGDIKSMPSAQPKRKTGWWIPQDNNKISWTASTAVYYYPECSECGCWADYTNFCPNCGAEMLGEDGEKAERRNWKRELKYSRKFLGSAVKAKKAAEMMIEDIPNCGAKMLGEDGEKE